MAWADYFWPGTSVLRNKLGITDPAELAKADYELAAMRTQEIASGRAPITASLDAAHLKSLHWWIFQDLYSFAGIYRDVPIAKGTHFAPPTNIDECLSKATDIIRSVSWSELDTADFADEAAKVFAWVNFAHPFREGNGRASRAFMDAVAANAHRWLDYSCVDPAVWNQRCAFSMPDLDDTSPQHHWLTPVFATMVRAQPRTIELPERTMRARDTRYDLGL